MNVAKKPDISSAEALEILERQYGIGGETVSLPSERDQNYRIRQDGGRQYVLKIAHPDESAEVLDFQTQALALLSQGPAPELFPQIIPTADGQGIFRYQGSAGTFLVRLLSYLPGLRVAEVGAFSEELLRDIGFRLGEMDRTLQPLAHASMHRMLEWDSKHAFTTIPKHLANIEDAARRRLIQECLRDSRAKFVPLMSRLPIQVIHNDVNDHNLLIGDDGRVSGIIDFGDMVCSYRACELANAAAYLMFEGNDPGQTLDDLVHGYDRANPLEPEEHQALPSLVCLRLCLSVCMGASQTKAAPENEYLTVSQASVWGLLERLAGDWGGFSDKVRRNPVPARTPAQIVSLRRRYLSGALSTSYEHPLKIVRGSGQYLFDVDGRRYLDCVNNVCHVGHCNPHVVAAAQEQIALLNTNTRYLHDNIVEYAERLTATLPDELSVCFFVNSGSEANDLALRLARTHTEAADFVVLDHAYHGHTQCLIDVSPYKYHGRGGAGPAPTTHAVAIPDRYRGPYGYSDPDAGPKYARLVREQVEEAQRSGRPIAGFIAESILGVAGQIELPPGYLECAYQTVRAAGGVCIADEVQVGFGRIGDGMWAFASQAVVPDILTLGKPIGNGHPLAAVITTPEIARSFETGMEYFNTFGGNPVSCAVGLAVLDVIESGRLVEHAKQVGSHFLERLRELKEQHDIIGDVRGRGLFIGVELVRDRTSREPATKEAAQILEAMKTRSILLSTDGPYDCVLKIKPPMVFDLANVDQFIAALAESIRAV